MNKYKALEGSRGLTRGLEGTIEVLVLSIVYYFVWRLGYVAGTFPAYLGNGKYVLLGIYALLSALFMMNFDGFRYGDIRKFNLAVGQWIAMFITNFITYLQLCLIANRLISVWPMVVLMGIDFVLVIAFVYLWTGLYQKIYAPHSMIMVFGTKSALGLKFKMDSRKDKYLIEKLISADEGFDNICKEIVNYDAVVINDIPAQLRNDILKFCYQNRIRTYVVPKISDILMRGAADNTLFDTPLLLVKSTGLSATQRFVKRAMDIIICGVAMIVAAPIMAVVAIAIKLEDGGPVFFKQDRATLNGEVFEILKFRSMIVDAEKEGFSIPATGEDPRITKVGKIIRATRIDELPQLLNILKGDMSIVGPRPERVEHVEAYAKDVPEFACRLKVKGGLTGYAQIYGKYNTSAYDKLRLDLIYIENYSLLLDIKLILLTLRVMLQKESTEGFEVMAEQERMKEKLYNEIFLKKDQSEEE